MCSNTKDMSLSSPLLQDPKSSCHQLVGINEQEFTTVYRCVKIWHCKLQRQQHSAPSAQKSFKLKLLKSVLNRRASLNWKLWFLSLVIWVVMLQKQLLVRWIKQVGVILLCNKKLMGNGVQVENVWCGRHWLVSTFYSSTFFCCSQTKLQVWMMVEPDLWFFTRALKKPDFIPPQSKGV